MQKVFEKIGEVVRIILSLPNFIIPKNIQDAIKGWRTVVINIIIGLLTALEGIDVIPLFESICAAVEMFGAECSIEGAAGVWAMIISTLNLLLRSITDTPVGGAKLEPESE